VSLAEYQSAARRVCFDREPSAEDLATLGSAERWLVYRSMVRARLVKVVHSALPRTREALGDDGLRPFVDVWLAEAPPDTRYFREVPERFAAHAKPRMREALAGRPWIADLVTYEIAAWRARYVDAEAPEVVDFHFDLRPAVDPTVALLRLEHPVDRRPTPAEGYAPEAAHLAVFRSADNQARTLRLNPMAFDLLERWMPGNCPLSTSVREVAEARSAVLDPAFVEKLSGMLADFLERGLLLGSRPD